MLNMALNGTRMSAHSHRKRCNDRAQVRRATKKTLRIMAVMATFALSVYGGGTVIVGLF
jgi:hypothetical protein